MILMETDRRDIAGLPIDNSSIIVQNCDCGGGVECDCMGVKTTTCNEFCSGAAVRIVIEDVPHKALVAGQIPIGLMSPDHELFAKNVSMNELIDRMIHPDSQQFFRIVATGNQYQNDSNPYLYADCTIETAILETLQPIDYSEAVGGDLMQYTTASGCCGLIRYYPTANYYDLSDIKIDTEQLPPDWYNITYQAQYYARVESRSTPGQLNCIDPTRKATSVKRFRMNHPGQVMQETVNLTPAPYMTSDQKSIDTTIEFYRPFTDILQDIFDEQYLLGSVNWVDWITPQFVPYLSFLLGLDLPYFPQSLYRLRKTMLRNVVRLQQLKGSRNAIYDLFELFGYIVYVNKLYWSKDGKRLIRPGEKLPSAYANQEIKIEESCQIEPVLVGYNTSGFGELTIPLLYRPTFTDEVQGIVNTVQEGDITLDAYLVQKNIIGSGQVSTNQTIDLFGDSDTQFTNDFVVGDTVSVANETTRIVATILDNHHLTVTIPFQNDTSNTGSDSQWTTYAYVSRAYKRLEEISCSIGTAAANCNNDPGSWKIPGRGTVSTNENTNLYGNSSTLFLTDFEIGDTVIVNGETERTVTAVLSDSLITVSVPFQNIAQSLLYTRIPKVCRTTTLLNDETAGVVSWSRVVIDRSATVGNGDDRSTGDQPPFVSNGVRIDRNANLLHLTFNGSIQFDDKYGQKGPHAADSELLLYAFATYSREELIVPDSIKDLYSNRFDIQLLTQNGEQIGGDILEFLIDYLFKIKAFHSLLNTLIYHSNLDETYQVTPFCVGGDLEQRWDIDAGKLQVPPAILPEIPTGECSVDPSDLGYKPEDIALRKRILANLPEEFQAWVDVNRYLEKPATIDSPNPTCIERIVTQIGDEKLPPTPPADSCAWGDPSKPCVDDIDNPCCKFTYRGQDRLVPGQNTENESIVYDPTPISNTPSIASQSTTDLSPIDNIIHGSFYPTGADASTNNDASEYGPFTKEFSVFPNRFCKLDGISDYCYKGRVEDEILRRMTMVSTEQYQATICKINFGDGVYYSFQATSELTNSVQGPALKQSYNENLPSTNNNFLGRLLRGYDTVDGENVHFTNRPYLTDGACGEKNMLALQRRSLGIQVPLMHFPGTRFATINKLESDFTHPKWVAKPWDDQYSTNCGPYDQACRQPTYLHAKLETATSGDQYLVFDYAPFVIVANGLQPDIPSFGSHILGTNKRFDDSDVIHSIYSTQSTGNPAITLETMLPPSRSIISIAKDYVVGGVRWSYGYTFSRLPTITIGIELKNLPDSIYSLSAKIIEATESYVTVKVYKTVLDSADLVFSECDTDDVVVNISSCTADNVINAMTTPLFSTAARCQGTSPYYIDYIDGYPAAHGYQPYVPDDFDRNGTFTELFNELEIDRSMPTGTDVLFFFISGILYTNGYRTDCGCAALLCDGGTSPTAGTDVLLCPIHDYQDDALPFTFSDGETRYGYDFNPDKITIDTMLYAEEKIGVSDLAFDGQLVWDEYPDGQTFQRQINMFELCLGSLSCQYGTAVAIDSPGYTPDYLVPPVPIYTLAVEAPELLNPGSTLVASAFLHSTSAYQTPAPPSTARITWSATIDGYLCQLRFAGQESYIDSVESPYMFINGAWGSVVALDIDVGPGTDYGRTIILTADSEVMGARETTEVTLMTTSPSPSPSPSLSPSLSLSPSPSTSLSPSASLSLSPSPSESPEPSASASTSPEPSPEPSSSIEPSPVTDEYTAELTVAATPSGTQPDPETSRYMALNFGLQWSVDPFIYDPSLFWSYQGDAQWIEAFSLDEQGGRQFYYMQMLEEPPWIQFVSVPEAGTIIWNEGTTTWNITANLSANTNANIFYISPSVYVDESGYGRLSVQLDLNIKKNGISIGTYTTTRDSTNDTTWAMINTTDGTVTIYPSPSPSPEPPIWTCELEGQWGDLDPGIGAGVRADFNSPYNTGQPVVAGVIAVYDEFDQWVRFDPLNTNNQPGNFSETGTINSGLISELTGSTKGIHGYGTWLGTTGSNADFTFRIYQNGELSETHTKTILDGTFLDQLWLIFNSSTGELNIINP